MQSPADLSPLLTHQQTLRRQLAELMERRLAESDAGEAARIEERTARLLDEILSDLSGVVSEAMRRGADLPELDAAYIELSGGSESLDPGDAFGPAGPESLLARSAPLWLESAEAGRAAAEYLLGQALVLRPVSEEGVREGVGWLERSAGRDFGPACLSLAHSLLVGEAGPADVPGGVALLERAASLDSVEACWRLGSLHASGDGVPLDFDKALQLLRRAADAGHAEAQLELGRILAVGEMGREIDLAAAKRWLSSAAEQHRVHAREWLETYGRMGPDEYRNATWLQAWTPEDLPQAPRAGCVGIVVSLGLLGLLVAATIGGNSLGLFLLLLFLVVLLHEGGHFLAAKLVGIPVLAVTVGLGPLVRSFIRRRGRLPMRVDLRLIPLLGSVRPYAVPKGIWEHWKERGRHEREGKPPPPVPEFDRNEEPEPVFLHVSRPRRLAFLTGGLVMNLLAAIGFLWAYENWSEEGRLWTIPVAGRVPAGSVAAEAGILNGDRFLEVDGKPVRGFFDVQRRIAPVERSGEAGRLPDPPGRKVPLLVRRGGTEVLLEWTTPAEPPAEDARESYGLFPTESWRVRSVRTDSVEGLLPGDEVVDFEASGRRIATAEPGARAAFRAAFQTGAEAVGLTVRRSGATVQAKARPYRESSSGPGRAPLGFERVREPGPGLGLVEVTGRVVAFGWNAVIGLPRMIVGSLAKAPTEEERGWMLAAVKKDPWAGVRIFALINAFLLFLNLLPIAPLDGFQILVCLIEMGARRPLPRRGMGIAMGIGLVVLGLWLVLNVVLILRDLAVSIF